MGSDVEGCDRRGARRVEEHDGRAWRPGGGRGAFDGGISPFIVAGAALEFRLQLPAWR